MKRAITLSVLMIFCVHAKVIIPQKSEEIKITIYNNNLAFVDEKRHSAVKKGRQSLLFEGVPSSVITQSVMASFKGPKIDLFSQNFIFDLVSLRSMLDKSISKEVSFYTNSKDPKLLKGTLLSVDPVMVQQNMSKKIFALEKPTQVIFSSIPADMITKPSLLWNIKSKASGKVEVDLKYLTRGIKWRSDYVADLDQKSKKLSLSGWITIKNNSGATYKNAQISCIAGELNLPRTQSVEYDDKMAVARSNSFKVEQQSIGGYHLYKIPFKEQINDKQQKQILFFDKKDISYKSYGSYISNNYGNRSTQKISFTNTIEFENTKKNNLGIPLPAGTFRIYQKDSQKQTHFMGQDLLANLPVDENVTIKVGKLFDVTGKKSITKYINTKNYVRKKMKKHS